MRSFFQNLDMLVYSAQDVVRFVPIDAGRLQMLAKRHHPYSEAALWAAGGKGSRRSYSARMIIWIALTNELMKLGISVSEASAKASFAFYHMDIMYNDIGRRGHAAFEQHREIMAVFDATDPTGIYTATEKLKDISFSTSRIVVPFGELLEKLSKSFPIR